MKKALSVLLFYATLLASSAHAIVAESYDKALTAFSEGEIQEAYILLKNVLQETPTHLPSKLLMGRILLIDGYVDEAITEFEDVLEAGGDENLVLGLLARAYLFSGDYEAIYEMLRRRNLEPDTKLAVILVAGSAYIRENKPEQAVALYEKHLASYSSSAPLLTSLATLYIDDNRLSEAEHLLSQAKKIKALEPDTLLVLAKLNEKREELDQAMQLYRQAYDIDPENPTVMRALASAYAQRAEYHEANELVKKIEEQTPGDIQNKLLKARILALTENQMEADKILTELSEQLSLLSDQQLNEKLELSLIAGVVAYINGNYDLASTSLTRYLSNRDATPELLGMLIDSMLRVGSIKNALDVVKKHEAVVVQNVQVASLTCELYLTVRRRFKCEQLMPTIEKNFPKAPEVSLLRAKILLNKGEREQALRLLDSKLSRSEDEEVLKLKAVLLSQSDAFQDALKYAQKLTEIEPENNSYQVLLAEIYLRLGMLERAGTLFDQILNRDPNMISAIIGKARIDFTNDELAKASAGINSALEIDKYNVSALLLAAQLDIVQKHFEQAIDRLVSAKTLNKSDVRPRKLLISVYQQQNDYRNALSEVNQLLTLDRLSADYTLRKAEILLELGRKEEAQKQLDIVYAHWSGQPQQLIKLSKYQVSANDVSGAEKSLKSAVEQAGKNIIPFLELSRFYIQQGELSHAEAEVINLINNFGVSPNTLLIKGELSQAQGEIESAFNYFKAAHETDPQFTLAMIRMYEIAQRDHLRQEMINYLSHFIEEHSGDYFAKHLLADIHYLDRSFDQALPLYESLLKINDLTNRHFVLNNLANIYAEKDLSLAHNYIDQALEVSPDSASLIDTKGWLLALSGEYKTALDKLRQSYTLNSSSPSQHYHLAYTLAKLGREDEAIAVFEDNNTLDKTFPEKDMAIALKNSLQ